MSQLPFLYREVSKLDKVKPVNIRIVVDERNPHPFAAQGRLRGFAQRNGVRLRHAFKYQDKRKHRVVLSVGDARVTYGIS